MEAGDGTEERGAEEDRDENEKSEGRRFDRRIREDQKSTRCHKERDNVGGWIERVRWDYRDHEGYSTICKETCATTGEGIQRGGGR